MYPQNTVHEEDNGIIVGFPGMGSNYRTRVADAEIGDIIGSDGHVEELPPYTRYAENALPKITSANTSAELAQPPVSPISNHSDSGVELNTGAAREAEVIDEKSVWKARARRRICLGLPCWVLALVIIVVMLAAALGGVIGGVVGQDRGADIAASASAGGAST